MSIVRCKLTSLESCKMSGCNSKHQYQHIKLVLCQTTELLNTGRQNTKKTFLTLSCLRNSQQNHKMSLICLIHKSVRSLESASDTYHTWDRPDTKQTGAAISICGADHQNVLRGSFVTQCPAQPSGGTKIFLSPQFTGQNTPASTEKNRSLTPIAVYRVKISEEYYRTCPTFHHRISAVFGGFES